jgi:nitroreductase
MDCIEALKTRRSVRAYTGEPVSREVIEDIIDCGRLAATAINIQPWEFVAVTEPAMLRAIAGVAEYGRFIAQAAVCVVVMCKGTKYYLEDGSNASQNILVAARAHGLGSCWVAGDKKPYAEKVARMLGAPEGYKVISLLSIGHAAEQPHKNKRALSDVLHWEKY